MNAIQRYIHHLQTYESAARSQLQDESNISG